MSLASGTKLGLYEVTAMLGAGGMGEVYRATDTKLGRSVAVKVLPEAFEFDADRVARFEREAKVLASLNHPHIAALYGMEEAGGRHFLVMELVEGETVAERIKAAGQGGLPVATALAIAGQIADALEAAHEKGIVHRDLKPANVKITPNDQVKVLDFGLAKAMANAPVAGSVTQSPTFSLAATQAGMILGTAAYMSPEQAKGFQADARSDVFSFGVVLYEMLTGRPAFPGDTVPDVLASVLVREPDLSALPTNLNPRLAEVVRRCLEKNPRRRWQAVGDLRFELEAIAAQPHATAPQTATPVVATTPAKPFWKRVASTLVVAVVATAITSAVFWALRPARVPPVITRFAFGLQEGQQFTGLSRRVLHISPDGAQIVYSANLQLFLRPLWEIAARPIAGTESSGAGAVQNPVFSPDGRSIAFYSVTDQMLKRIAVAGGAAVTICPADSFLGMSWSETGILFAQAKGISRVSANGGRPEALVSMNAGEVAASPQMLPGGSAMLFTLAASTGSGRWEKARIVVQSLKSGERKTLVEGGSDAQYVPTGHLVYAIGGVLFAIPFDPQRLEVAGGPVPVVEGVRRGSTGVVAYFGVSQTGSLAFVPGPTTAGSARRDLALIDRKGTVNPLKLPPGSYDHPRVSPDGKQLAFATDDSKDAIVWVYELGGGTSMRRLTFGGRNQLPIWSADSRRVTFQSDKEGDQAIFWQPADGTGTAERLTKPEQGTSHVPEAWSPDGTTLLFSVAKGSTTTLWTLSLPEKKAAPFGGIQTSNPPTAIFSSDGRWVAYDSMETGRSAVFVQPFPATGAKYQISKDDAGHHPVWSPDGKELFYIPGPGQFMSVHVTTRPGFAFTNPTAVPKGGFFEAGPSAVRSYDITPDGKYIVGTIDAFQAQTGAPAAPQIQVVLNWFEELKQRVPIK